jgi:hypothetical protein
MSDFSRKCKRATTIAARLTSTLKILERVVKDLETEVFGAGGVGGRRPQKQDVQTHYTVKNSIKSDFGVYLIT